MHEWVHKLGQERVREGGMGMLARAEDGHNGKGAARGLVICIA